MWDSPCERSFAHIFFFFIHSLTQPKVANQQQQKKICLSKFWTNSHVVQIVRVDESPRANHVPTSRSFLPWQLVGICHMPSRGHFDHLSRGIRCFLRVIYYLPMSLLYFLCQLSPIRLIIGAKPGLFLTKNT